MGGQKTHLPPIVYVYLWVAMACGFLSGMGKWPSISLRSCGLAGRPCARGVSRRSAPSAAALFGAALTAAAGRPGASTSAAWARLTDTTASAVCVQCAF